MRFREPITFERSLICSYERLFSRPRDISRMEILNIFTKMDDRSFVLSVEWISVGICFVCTLGLCRDWSQSTDRELISNAENDRFTIFFKFIQI